MATSMSLLFLVLAGARFITANRWDSEVCGSTSLPMEWEIHNLTVSGSDLNDTVAAPYSIKFSIQNTYVAWPQDCEAEVVPPPEGPESSDGDSGWLPCGRFNSPPEPPLMSSILTAPPTDNSDVSWKKVQISPGTPGIHRPVDDKGHPLAVIIAQSPTRRRPPPTRWRKRPSIQDYGGGMFRFNWSSGVLYITQRWGCYYDNTTEWITNFNAIGSTLIPDFSCAARAVENAASIPRPPVRLFADDENRQDFQPAGTSDRVTDDDHSADGVIYDCVPRHRVTALPSEIEAWVVSANDTCAWNNDCLPPGI